MPRPIQPDGLLHGAVVGIRDDAGRWLLIRRSEHVMAPGKICFPGGAIEIGEPPAVAARREIREELGVEVTRVEHVWNYRCPDRPLRLFGFRGEVASHRFQVDAYEVAELLWLTRDQVRTHRDVLPGTEQFVAALEAGNAPPASPRICAAALDDR